MKETLLDEGEGEGEGHVAGKQVTQVGLAPGDSGPHARADPEADPEITEERKWIKPTNPSGVPVWSHAGIVCTGETYAKVVKLTNGPPATRR